MSTGGDGDRARRPPGALGLPRSSETHQAYIQASHGFAPGVLSPTTILVEAPEIVERRPALVRLQRALERQPGMALVAGPAQQRVDVELGAVLSRTRDVVRYIMVFDADPLGAAGIDHLRTLRARLPALTAAAGLSDARTSIAGDTALAEETVRLTGADLGRVAPIALLAIFAVLVVFLRALVAPAVPGRLQRARTRRLARTDGLRIPEPARLR